MEATINIDEKRIAKLIEETVAERLAIQYLDDNRDTKYGIRKGVEEAVRDYIYERKDEITERAVERAASEITRKGLRLLSQH